MNWAALRWARKHGVRLAYTSDSNLRDPQRRLVAPVKRLVLRYFFHYVDVFFATSEANEDYLLSFYAQRSKIHRIPFAIDVGRFKRAASADPARRYDFIWAGKFISLKRAGDFIQALDVLAQRDTRPIKACIVGDGPLRESLHRQAEQLPSHCSIEFMGFVNQRGMPGILQAAEALVFTSDREAYGLIAAEAAAAGLALVVADNIGCVGASDLARQGINALTYPTHDVPALARAMGTLLDEPTVRHNMQRASARIAGESDLPRAAALIEGVIGGATA
jgi:glycosyltransferase involved in cell wall biosynthesis